MWPEDWIVSGKIEVGLLILAHGAGAPMDSDFMNALVDVLVREGVMVVRFEFPYMQLRRKDGKRRGPNKPEILEETWHEVYQKVKQRTELPLWIGGKSMGGRYASRVADALNPAGLICLGYPFHPPKKPEKLRTAHLADLKTKALILQGTRDPFGSPEEVASYHLSDAIRLHWLDDGDHSFKPRKRSGRTLYQNIEEAGVSIAEFLRATS